LTFRELNRQKELLDDVVQGLASKAWFGRAGWIAATHFFPKISPDGVTLNVFKAHWLNDTRDGIHIETFLGKGQITGSKSYVALHVFHKDSVPGTKLKRKAITKPFVDAIYEDVVAWPGYAFRAGKYGMQPFTYRFVVAEKGYVKTLSAELERVCRVVGPAMDRVLEEVLG
jgi:hypothetical protein